MFNNQKNIIIIDHFSKTPDEPGNNRFIYLGALLCDQGFNVEIITTDFSHLKKQHRKSNNSIFKNLPYKYTMLPEPGYQKNVCLRRFYSHYVFGKHLNNYLKSIPKPDLVLVAVPSLDVGAVAGKYCKKNHIPFIVDIQDLWPEAFKLILRVPILNDILFLPMTITANKFYKQADRIIAVSNSYKNRGVQNSEKDPNGLCVFLGTDLDTFDKNKKSLSIIKNTNELWVVYVGTLGASYNIDIIFEALDRIPKQLTDTIVFHVFGDGPNMTSLKKRAKSCQVQTIFHGRVDYAEMSAFLYKSDIAVNPIVKGAAQSIINKHADYAAAGLPVVNTQECQEYRSLIEEYSCGINCEVNSVKQVTDALIYLIKNPSVRKQMGSNSRIMAEKLFDRKFTYLKIIKEIEELTR